MSKYEETATELRDAGHLIAALSELGYRAEFHPNGAALAGYEGRERPEKAHVIVRRSQLDSASNDIGFLKKADGTFAAVLSEYDRSIGFNENWLSRVHQVYKDKQVLADARAKGYILHSREIVQTPDGPQIRLQFLVR